METELEHKWKQEINNAKLGVYDDCMVCGKAGRLNKGMCFSCWTKFKKGLISAP